MRSTRFENSSNRETFCPASPDAKFSCCGSYASGVRGKARNVSSRSKTSLAFDINASEICVSMIGGSLEVGRLQSGQRIGRLRHQVIDEADDLHAGNGDGVALGLGLEVGAAAAGLVAAAQAERSPADA